MDLGIAEHVAVVTGGGRGLGEAITSAFAREGAHVVVWDRDDSADEHAERITNSGGSASAVQADVTDPAAVNSAVAGIADRHGRIDVLVNCAGFSRDAPVAEMTDEQWLSVIDVCLNGAFYATRACVPHMRARGYGRIINISSRARFGDLKKVNYVAAKSGIDGLTYALAMELGKDGITANAIAPGFCETERARNLPYYAELRDRAIEKTYTDRLGRPSDIANAALYLASADAGYISGEVLTVSGGRWR